VEERAEARNPGLERTVAGPFRDRKKMGGGRAAVPVCGLNPHAVPR